MQSLGYTDTTVVHCIDIHTFSDSYIIHVEYVLNLFVHCRYRPYSVFCRTGIDDMQINPNMYIHQYTKSARAIGRVLTEKERKQYLRR